MFRLLLAFTIAFTFALGFTLAVPKGACGELQGRSGSLMRAPHDLQGDPSADACQTVSKIVNGEYRVCRVCCTDAGACQEFCH
ncbi:MAG: hypothetical protein AMXMBFR67_35410 [Nitrospira sp.]